MGRHLVVALGIGHEQLSQCASDVCSSLFAGGAFTTADANVSAYAAWAILSPPQIIATNADFGFTNAVSSQFSFDVSAGLDQTIVVPGSSNLVNWVPLQTNILAAPLQFFADPSAGNFSRRFYRVLRLQ